MSAARRLVRALRLFGALLLLQGCVANGDVQLIADGQPSQDVPPGSNLLPRGEIDYLVAPLDVLQVEVDPQQVQGALLDYGSQLRIEAAFSGGDYAIAPGDTLSIEMNAETDSVSQVAVRPDGFITLPHLSADVQAAGRTATDLAAAITERYAVIMKSPQITVSVVSSATDQLGRIGGSYQVGADGQIVLPILGAFMAFGRTPAAVAADISAAANSRFRNAVRISASAGQLTGRDVDPRVDPNGRSYFRAAAKVSPDGTIYVPPGGAVRVAGMSLAAARTAVLAALRPLYANPITVNVALAETGGLNVFVGGEVRQPGRYPYTKSMTLLQVISLSGWVTDVGDLSRVLLLHPTSRSHYNVYQTNLRDVLYRGAVDQDLAVGPQDIVVVPMTFIGQLDRFVDQYIRKVLPFETSATYSYISNPVGNATSTSKTSP